MGASVCSELLAYHCPVFTLPVLHEVVHCFEVFSTFITQLGTSWVDLVIVATAIFAAKVAAVQKVSTWLVGFVCLSDVLCQINPVDEVHVTGCAYIPNPPTHPLVLLRDCLPPREMGCSLVLS